MQRIARRYEKTGAIITANLAFSKRGERFGSATLTNAALKWLLHHSQVISITRPFYRRRKNKLPPDRRRKIEREWYKNTFYLRTCPF
ncbi:MAG: ATP-binding protein [Firmicutes bacterium]|nr:ATP-binding protein [Bacillota bacterium]